MDDIFEEDDFDDLLSESDIENEISQIYIQCQLEEEYENIPTRQLVVMLENGYSEYMEKFGATEETHIKALENILAIREHTDGRQRHKTAKKQHGQGKNRNR